MFRIFCHQQLGLSITTVSRRRHTECWFSTCWRWDPGLRRKTSTCHRDCTRCPTPGHRLHTHCVLIMLVRGVDGSCAEHLTVESYTLIICQQSYLLLFGIPSPTHPFIPGLKPSFSANPSHRSPSFFFFKTHYMDSPDCLLLFLSISAFYFLVFLFFYTF